MKKLLMTLAACATTLLASAAIKTSEGFESGLGGFSGGGEAVEYGAAPAITNYPFAGAGDYYCEIDADGNDALVSPAASDATYFDMYIQFPANASEPDPDVDGAKLAVYVNSDNKLVVLSGGETPTNVTETTITPGAWARLTIAKVTGGYQVYVDGTAVSNAAFTPIISGDPSTVAFTGCGKLDNFVARTTDPFGGAPANWIAKEPDASDPEQYYTDYTDALTAALNGTSLTFNDGMDGTAAHPFEIRTLADLKALQAAVADVNNTTARAFCYVLTADIVLDAAWPGIGIQNGKDIYSTADFDAAAFCGTFDGQNHTISGFQMIGKGDNAEGLDYCGFFNSTYGATIKNLKIQYAGALFAADTTASTKESGATFVGVAKSSTLQNLTSLQKDASTGVSCSKGFGGIVGYFVAGSTVENCTNNVNMTSLANNKCGGIAMIRQGGSGSAVIRNCQNNGTVTTGSTNGEFGGIVGYVGDDITIADCESIVAYKFFHRQKRNDGSVPVVTMFGVNKGKATTVPAYTSVPGDALVTGLNFATVDGDVATFVADDALVLDGTVEYKVMNAKAAYAFAAAGTLALDQSLAAATVTADTSTLVLSDETVDNVTTYTAVAGVASVGGQMYATMQDAFDAVTAQNNTVTLLSDLTETVTLNPNETVTITLVPNNHNITTATPFAAANGIALGVMSDNGDGTWSMNVINNKASTWTGTAGDELWATASNWSTGVVPGEYTTVTFNDDGRVRIASDYDVVSVAGMVVNAAVTFSETNIDYSKYPAVKICGGNVTGTGTLTLERCGLSGNSSQVEVGCDLVFKGDSATTHDCFLKEGPFVFNGAVSSTLGRLHLLTPVTFNGSVTLGNATMTSTVSGGAAPTFNGPVTLGTGATISTYAVTYNNALTIGEGAVVSVGSSTQTYGENFTMTGSGRFIGDTQMPGSKVLEALTQSTWTGTLELKGMTITQTNGLQTYGNADSKVCFNNVTTYLHRNGNAVGGIEVGAGGLKVNGTYSAGDWNLPELSGVGTFTVGTAGNGNKNFNFPADCSEFSGSIAFASDTANTRVVFGTTDRDFKEKTICVGSNATVGAGASWVAVDEIYLDGVVYASAATSLSTVVGSGKIVYGAVPTGTHVFGEGWSGIGALDYKGDTKIDLANYVNTIAAKCSCDTVEIVESCTMSGDNYFGADVTPELKVSGFVLVNDGSSYTKRVVSSVTGDGVLVFGTKGGMVNYAIDNVVGWNGVITNSASTTLITNIVSGAGTVYSSVKPTTAPAFGSNWKGTYAIGYSLSGTAEEKAAVDIDAYGVEGSTVKLSTNADNVYLAKNSAPPTISATLMLDATMTIKNGWSRTSASEKITTIGTLSATENGALVLAATPGDTSQGAMFNFALPAIKDYAGTITVGQYYRVTIGGVYVDAEPAEGAVILPMTVAEGAVLGGDLKLYVGGEDSGETLVYDAEKGGLVIYVAVPGIDPSQGATVDVDTTKSEEDQRTEAETKANTMDVVKTAAASNVDQATWNGYFTRSVEKVGDGWVATATLNPAVVLPVDEVEETPLTDMLESVTEAALYTEKTAASVPTKAGLYYWIAGATEVGATTYTPGTAQLGDGTTKELAMPVLSGENGKAFYKVCVDLEAPVTAP